MKGTMAAFLPFAHQEAWSAFPSEKYQGSCINAPSGLLERGREYLLFYAQELSQHIGHLPS